MNKNPSQSLLPPGFADHLPPENAQESDAVNALMALYQSYGYKRVKPPLVEYEESLLGDGPGAALKDETFRLMDPVSHKMLALRSDSTPQISRIAAFRLGDIARPLRLTYANDVVRTRASQERLARQFTQVGCEIFGDITLGEQAEIAVLSVLGLYEIGIQNVTIDLALPRLLGALCDLCKVDEAERGAISEAVRRRDRDFFALQKSKIQKIIYALLDTDLSTQDKIKKLQNMGDKALKALAGDVLDIFDSLCVVKQDLRLDDLNISLDVFEHKGFDYHSGVAFTLFAKGLRGELGRGGQYHVDQDGSKATGFTLYMDTIRSGFEIKSAQKTILVSFDESWSELQKLQTDGWITVRGDLKNVPDKCTHIYKNNEIKDAK